jgi:hypothetical protein
MTAELHVVERGACGGPRAKHCDPDPRRRRRRHDRRGSGDGRLTWRDPRPARGLGVAPEDVTDVIFSHHHPDHTLNAALFPNARFHDFMAIYKDDIARGG